MRNQVCETVGIIMKAVNKSVDFELQTITVIHVCVHFRSFGTGLYKMAPSNSNAEVVVTKDMPLMASNSCTSTLSSSKSSSKHSIHIEECSSKQTEMLQLLDGLSGESRQKNTHPPSQRGF